MYTKWKCLLNLIVRINVQVPDTTNIFSGYLLGLRTFPTVKKTQINCHDICTKKEQLLSFYSHANMLHLSRGIKG